MLQYIQSFMERVKAEIEFNANKKAKDKELNASVTCEVGQIFKYSWGYDQTNVDYYEVQKVKGKSMIVCKIGAHTDATGWAMGKSTPHC